MASWTMGFSETVAETAPFLPRGIKITAVTRERRTTMIVLRDVFKVKELLAHDLCEV